MWFTPEMLQKSIKDQNCKLKLKGAKIVKIILKDQKCNLLYLKKKSIYKQSCTHNVI